MWSNPGISFSYLIWVLGVELLGHLAQQIRQMLALNLFSFSAIFCSNSSQKFLSHRRAIRVERWLAFQNKKYYDGAVRLWLHLPMSNWYGSHVWHQSYLSVITLSNAQHHGNRTFFLGIGSNFKDQIILQKLYISLKRNSNSDKQSRSQARWPGSPPQYLV